MDSVAIGDLPTLPHDLGPVLNPGTYVGLTAEASSAMRVLVSLTDPAASG